MPFDFSIIGQVSTPSTFRYTWKETVLYALGIGAKRDELDFLYEGRGPKVIPSFAVVPMFEPMFEQLRKTGGSFETVVHGGQKVSILKPLASQGTLETTAKIVGIYDMRKFGVVHVETTAKDSAGDVVFKTLSSIIYRGEGGFGGEPPPKEASEVALPKDRAPDFVVEETSSPEQALLYRLSGDFNPLHADPEFAAKVGFAQGPILHGLCTYGFMVRHVAKGACAGDASRITGFDAQFRRPVWPGDTIVTEGYLVGEGKLALRVSVKERNEAVLGGAQASFRTS